MSLLDSLAQSVTPDMLGSLGKSLGMDSATVKKGMDVVAPLLQGGLANASKTPQGLDSIMKMLPADTSSLSGILQSFTGGGNADAISGLVQSAFGDGSSAIAKTISGKLGFNVAPLVGTAVPALLAMVSKTAKEKKLDANGVATMLQDESKAFMDKGGPTVDLINEAVGAGQQAGALKQKFSTNEWAKVRLAPVAAAGLIVAASPSGATGLAQEVAAGTAAVAAARDAAGPVSILSMAFNTDFSTDELSKFGKDTPKSVVLSALRDAVAAVAAKSPADAAAFRAMLMGVGTRVAEAAKEGGFLGIGGTQVSKEEQAALAELKAAIGA